MSTQQATRGAVFEDSRLISCVVPDTGIGRDLIQALREEQQILAATTATCRGISMLRGIRSTTPAEDDRLPPSELVHLVEVVVPDARALELFDFIYNTAKIGREGGGAMWMSRLIRATPYTLPTDLPEEQAG